MTIINSNNILDGFYADSQEQAAGRSALIVQTGDRDDRISVAELWGGYRAWCRLEGKRASEVLSRTDFARHMSTLRGITPDRTERGIIFRGIRWADSIR